MNNSGHIDNTRKKLAEELKNSLRNEGISQKVFSKKILEIYYPEMLNENEEEKHYERFKKVLQGKRSNPEQIALYHFFFKKSFTTGGSNHPEESRNAAYEFSIEMKHRISCQPMEEGKEKAALDS